MRRVVSATFILIAIFISFAGKADHIAGADLTYVCLGNDQYQINLTVYADCSASSVLNSQQTIRFNGSCGTLSQIQIDLVNPGGTEISQLCASEINNSTCNGGALPGMKAYYFSGIITIAPPCNAWTIYWATCCRNFNLVNIPGTGNSIYVEAQLNSLTASCNNSPVFHASPIPYVCVNQQVNYNIEMQNPDGDSLYYTFISARNAGGAPLTYAGGYSATSPLPGILLDPINGQLTFTPTAIGTYVVVVQVSEYDNSGTLIGSVMRDIEFVVLNCINSAPDATSGMIADVSDDASKSGPYSLEVCERDFFTFKTIYTDPDVGDALKLSSDIFSVLPGAVFTTSGTNPVTATFSWTAPPGSVNTVFKFKVNVNDGSCPIPSEQEYDYEIKIKSLCTSGIIVPNVFTPGGENSSFIINTYGLMDYHIQIMDRWGNAVFESMDPAEHWNGNNVSDGTYFYLIHAKGMDGKEYDKKGFVQRIGVR